MKVLLPEGTKLEGLERKLQITLEQANLAGYALMGFTFREALSGKLHEIDALVVMEPGVFVCLEAKGYTGTWTGSANEKWLCDGREIRAASTTNPYKQVDRYSQVIKDKLKYRIFSDIDFWVNYFVVTPDETKVEIKSAVIDQFQPGRAVSICHISMVEQVIGSIKTNESVDIKVREIGLEKIISELTDIPPDQLKYLIVNKQAIKPLVNSAKKSDTKSENVNNKSSLSHLSDSSTRKVNPLSILNYEKIGFNNIKSNLIQKNKISNTIILAITCLIFFVAGTSYFIKHNTCDDATEIKEHGVCYKNIYKTPVVIGILTSPKQYSELKSYINQQRDFQSVDIVIDGSSDIKFQDAQNNIAQKNWDIVFALSPMNGMRAKDNGYKWIARMFPKYPPTYQSALFVKKDSSIQSINDINASTTVALGDFSSASSFYMPSYDLYGKSMKVTAGHRSSKILDLVAQGVADVGATVYSNIKDDSRFRVIHVSREIPSTGVYLSPKLSPSTQEKIQKLLLNAPQKIKDEANYGDGKEPNYEIFRTISLRADEVISCSDFSKNPVQFFCNNQDPQGIVGKINGFTNLGNGMIRLRLEQENGKIYHVLISLQILSSIPNGTSPGLINKKQVNVIGVEPKELQDGIYELIINNPAQLVVL